MVQDDGTKPVRFLPTTVRSLLTGLHPVALDQKIRI